MKIAVLILSFMGFDAFAGPARYSIYGKCYVVKENGRNFSTINYGRFPGLSGYDCDNAYENLLSACDHRAQKDGYVSGNVFKDILVIEKASSSAANAQISERRGGLFNRVKAVSVELGASESSSTGVQYIQLDEREGFDCRKNTRYPQEDAPTIQGSHLGG